MSRKGKQPINIPTDVMVSIIDKDIVHVKGIKGILQQKIDSKIIIVEVYEKTVRILPVDPKKYKALYGLYRVLIYNMVIGVSIGFKSTLELVGVGYKANIQGSLLELNLGYSHDIIMVLPEEIIATTELLKGKNTLIHLESIDKQLLGQVLAKIRSLRKPDPYKGKGIRFLGEEIRRKTGKSSKK